MEKTFNMFEILSKDDKELIHSAMLKFLFEENKYFIDNIIGENIVPDKFILKLEKKKGKNNRIDIEICDINNNPVCILENKFKSFPTIDQLNAYDKESSYKNSKKILVSFKTHEFYGWKCISYETISSVIDNYIKIFDKNINSEKRLFIEHYNSMLKTYINKFNEIKENVNLNEIFLKKENSFYLQLFFYLIKDKILKENQFSDKFSTIYIGGGNTFSPFINFHFKNQNHEIKEHINDKKQEFLIQLNGSKIKYYSHLHDNPLTEVIINNEIERLKNKQFDKLFNGNFKKNPKSKHNTQYIYQTDLLKELDEINLDSVLLFINDFYNKINF